MSKLKDIIRQSYDLHVHIGPEIIPRKFTVDSLIRKEEGKIGGIALKNHFYPTTPFIAEAKTAKLRLIGSVVLNNFIGGLNIDAIYATSVLGNGPFIVWFPTIHARQFLNNSKWEIAPEWVDKRKQFIARPAKSVSGIRVIDKNEMLTEDALAVLRAIKDTGAILATGHISWQESRMLVKAANRMGITKIIVTHPIYQRINMPIEIQKKLTALGAKIEHCYSMYSIDKIPMTEITKQIKDVGVKNCILSSDVGQLFSPSPSEALEMFGGLLQKEGVTLTELQTMLVDNPEFLIRN